MKKIFHHVPFLFLHKRPFIPNTGSNSYHHTCPNSCEDYSTILHFLKVDFTLKGDAITLHTLKVNFTLKMRYEHTLTSHKPTRAHTSCSPFIASFRLHAGLNSGRKNKVCFFFSLSGVFISSIPPMFRDLQTNKREAGEIEQHTKG